MEPNVVAVPRSHPAFQQLIAAARAWRVATDAEPAAVAALEHYATAAATLIGFGVTLFDLDPMDCLPDELMPLVWREAYAETFADAVALGHPVVAAD